MRHELWRDGVLVEVTEVADIAETPAPPEERLTALEDAVDTLILDQLGGQ